MTPVPSRAVPPVAVTVALAAAVLPVAFAVAELTGVRAIEVWCS